MVFLFMRHSDSPSTESSTVDSVGTKRAKNNNRILHGLSDYDEGNRMVVSIDIKQDDLVGARL